jgi:predicted ATP-grasp superfamily ATP-dependent carboligase
MSSSITPALIIGRPNANMLAQARALGRCGIPVYCLVHRGEPAFIIKACRYVACVEVIKSGRDDDVAARIRDLHARAGSKPVLFFAGDADITLIHRIWPQIKNNVICISDAARADYLNDKSVQIAMLKKAGIRVPDSWCISSLADASKVQDQFRYPIICKPVELSRRSSMSEKYYIAQNGVEFSRWITSIFSKGRPDILIQEYIEGGADNLYVALAACDETGRVISLVCGRKLYEYPEGLMCIGETVEHPAFRDLCLRAFSELRLAGVLALEFKQDGNTDEFVFIETNLRPGNFLAIALAAGVNLMEQAYYYTIQGRVSLTNHKPGKVIWRDISMLLLSNLSGKYPPKINKGNATIVDAYFSISDPLPALAWYVVKVWRLLRKIARRSSLSRR